MIILFSFVIQAVSYEFQNKLGNILGARTFQTFLIINGVLGPVLLGGAVATFFNGSNFIVDKGNITTMAQPVISRWANGSHGLDALLDLWNVVLGVAVFFLARVLGLLYIINNVAQAPVVTRARKQLRLCTVVFLAFFLSFLAHMLLKDGYAYDPKTGIIFMQPLKYLHNLTTMWYLAIVLLVGVASLLYGIVRTLRDANFKRGIWFGGVGVVLVVLVLLLCAGWNNTAYYPSNADLQSSLTIANSSGSKFTLTAMSVVSLLIPFVLVYIFVAWRAIDRKPITEEEIMNGEGY
jgi:cytochrome D ubiquinol oxidase subunit II